MFTEVSKPTLALPNVLNWAVARTGARWEKKVKEQLEECGAASFLPLVERRKVYGRHIRTHDLPLFPGYVFFDRDSVDINRLYAFGKVAQILSPDNSDELRQDLENIARVLSQKSDIQVVECLPPGTQVEVQHGPMKGVVGTMIRRGAENFLVVRVRFLGAVAELEIDEALVVPLS